MNASTLPWRTHALPLILVVSLVLAATRPFATPPTPRFTTEQLHWPETFEGRPLVPAPLLPLEARFVASFPGSVAAFNDGPRRIVIRHITQPTRKVHPIADCLRASGFSVVPRSARRFAESGLWANLTAARDGRTLIAREQITDVRGTRTWTDVSAWFWHALFHPNDGPWFAIVVIEPAGSDVTFPAATVRPGQTSQDSMPRPHPVTRRDALRSLGGLALIAGAGAPLRAATGSSATTPMPTPTSSALRQSVCQWCFRNMSLDELCSVARAVGIESVELLGPESWPVVRKRGLTCAMGNGASSISDGLNDPANHAVMIPAFRERLAAAAEAGVPNIICFSGNRRALSDEEGLENCVTALKQIVSAAEKAGVMLCMELLNSKVDHIDYMCDHTAWGVELVNRVGSTHFKLLYDIYHMQIMEGDVIRTIRDHHTHIAHYHTAGNPGRHEFTRPEDVQELNYSAIMRAIRDTGYTGFIGQEFIPTRDPASALREAVEMCAV